MEVSNIVISLKQRPLVSWKSGHLHVGEVVKLKRDTNITQGCFSFFVFFFKSESHLFEQKLVY